MQELLIAKFNKSCPYSVPMYIEKRENQTVEDFKDSLGYKRLSNTDKVEFESKDSYFERMSGILALYAALIQINNVEKNSFFGLSTAWTWIASLLNSKPRDITATILLVFLEVFIYPYILN